jgi:cytoskeleton protein RodZ
MDQQAMSAPQDMMDKAKAFCGGREKPDGEANPAGEVGWFLQREREQRKLTLEMVSEQIGVHPYHIEAIEHGDMTSMPERVESLQMIAAYADFLGFHPEPLLEHYVNIMPLPRVAPVNHPADPQPLSSARVLKFGKNIPKLPKLNIKLPQFSFDQNGVVASVAAAFMLFAGTTWLLSPGQNSPLEQVALQPTEDSDPMPTATTGLEDAEVKIIEEPMPTNAVASVPTPAVTPPAQLEAEQEPELDSLGVFIEQQLGDELQATAPEQSAAAKTVPAESQVAVLEPVAPTEEPSPVASAKAVAQEEPVTAKAETPSEPAVAETTDGKIFGAENENARLILRAKAPAWVRIEDRKGNIVLTQMLSKGDVYRVPDRDGLLVITKDGGLIGYSIDGKDRGTLGKPGEILAGETIDIAALESKG